MAGFRCIPIPSSVAERFRRTGRDDRGNTLRRTMASGPGFPCRHCLRCAADGEEVLLGSYVLPGPQGIYWTPSPVFLHADACTAFAKPDTLAPIIVANTLVSVRAYDAADQCLYELGEVCSGEAALPPLRRALDDARCSFVNVHTARPGCLLCRVERVRT